jgi:hypothetical protein
MATHFRNSYVTANARNCVISEQRKAAWQIQREWRADRVATRIQKLVRIRSGPLRLEMLFEVSYPVPALSMAVGSTAAFGATLPLPRVPVKVPSHVRHRTLSTCGDRTLRTRGRRPPRPRRTVTRRLSVRRTRSGFEQFHARLSPNNATRLSGTEWLWPAKRA